MTIMMKKQSIRYRSLALGIQPCHTEIGTVSDVSLPVQSAYTCSFLALVFTISLSLFTSVGYIDS